MKARVSFTLDVSKHVLTGVLQRSFPLHVMCAPYGDDYRLNDEC